jgi:PD-(D/E)XK nuclease superfamily
MKRINVMEIIEPGYTRVSEVLGIFQSYAHIDKAKLKKKQDLGTDIHDAIETYWKGGFSAMSAKHDLYFDSFLKWMNGKNVIPVFIEQRFYHRTLKLTGKIDLVCLKDNVPMIIDYKTGSWLHPEIWQLQATMYRMLLAAENREILPNEFLFLKLMPDASPPIEIPMIYNPDHEEVCKAALQCYRYFNPVGTA